MTVSAVMFSLALLSATPELRTNHKAMDLKVITVPMVLPFHLIHQLHFPISLSLVPNKILLLQTPPIILREETFFQTMVPVWGNFRLPCNSAEIPDSTVLIRLRSVIPLA